MTLEGSEALRAELEHLKREARPAVVTAIAEAREHGDLKENAEYHAAREQQSFIEGRIQDIEGKLSNAQIIDIKTMPASDKVIFGTTVVILNLDNNQESTYKLVGDDEADVKSNKISVASPMGRALIGKYEGDDVIVVTPAGETEYEIVKVEYL